MTTLHILSNPSNPVSVHNRIDPFSILAYKFITYMSLYGWKCIHYGVVGSEVMCENVLCLPEITDSSEKNTSIYNKNAAAEIAKRKSPGDMIVCFYGWQNREATEQHPDLTIVEPSTGYDTSAIFAPYRIFPSYAHMHMFYGSRNMLMNPSWFDAVIPNGIDSREFEFTENKEDYFLTFGRVIESKGIHVAIQATKELGKKLIIAGPGNLQHLGYTEIPSHVEFVGPCNVDQRNKLMRNAKALIAPTYYVEPFGNMVVEGLMSGTPAITTDWGGFVDTVVHGKTGFRCREFKEFLSAIDSIDEIDPNNCRDFAVSNFDDPIIHNKINDYFIKLNHKNFYRQ
jgi:glycosyltransferase involved in cell wall biosynthesis